MTVDESMVSLTRYAQAAGIDSGAARRAALRGEIESIQDSKGFWWVAKREVERVAAQKRAERAASAAAGEVPASHDALRDLARRFHLLGIEREVILDQLEGDAREALQHNDGERERGCREMVDALRRARYSWDSAALTWKIDMLEVTVYEAPRGYVTQARSSEVARDE